MMYSAFIMTSQTDCPEDTNHMPESKPKLTIIEENQRFSQSIVWKWQRTFFSREGAQAWSKGTVPHYVTSNPYIAQAYAHLIFGWIRDIADSLDTSQPVYIVELGAGSGRFAYHFLVTFFEFFDNSALKDIPICYVLTEFNKATRDFWKRHSQLKKWVDAGRLDFAKFDGESDTSIVLMNKGERIASDTLKNPMAFIANYFFDGLPQDLFRVENSTLHEYLATISLPAPPPDINDPILLEHITINYQAKPTSTDYYHHPMWNQLLEEYQSLLHNTNLLFPTASFDCLKRLHEMSNGRMLMVSADKGFHRQSDLMLYDNPGLSVHGSFSMTVNYHAIGRYVELCGGQFLNSPHRHGNLDMCVILYGDHPQGYHETRQAYHREFIRHNPQDFYVIKNAFDELREFFSLEQFVSYLRLSNWDSHLFSQFLPVMLEHLSDIPAYLKEDLYYAMLKLWEMYFYIGEEYDMPFSIGGVLYGLERFKESLVFFQHSIQFYGKHASTLCNIAMCWYSLDDYETALDFVKQSLELDPDYELANELLAELKNEIRR